MGVVNAQGCKGKTDQIQQLINENKYDIFDVTESWLKEDDPLSQTILNEMFANEFKTNLFSRESRKGGGIIIASKKSLKIKEAKKGKKETYEFVETLLVETMSSGTC